MDKKEGKKILMVYPKTPDTTYWSFKYSLPFIGKKAAVAPLGPITVAAMLPDHHEVRFIDMNVESLSDDDIRWADAVFTSSMIIHKDSLEDVVKRAKLFGRPIVAGGPFPTQYYDKIEGVDHFVLGEAESGSLDAFIKDFERGEAKRAYARVAFRKRPEERDLDERDFDALKRFFGDDSDIQIADSHPDMSRSPIPRHDLLKVKDYESASIQYSRGCPHSCEFCNESQLYGHSVRIKPIENVIKELKMLYDLGFRGSVFFVDDDFIGNKAQVKKDLVEIKRFQEEYRYPFSFYTESTIDLAHDPELMISMRDAGFSMIFAGIETPDEAVLRSMNKHHNLKKGASDDARTNLLMDVRTIQRYGMEVTGGFIVGNDADPPDICDKIFEFCQEAGIPIAMAGLLTAMKGSPLYERLNREGRLLRDSEGDNTHSFDLNFVPVGDKDKIVGGYRRLLKRLYDFGGKNYYKRCSILLDNLENNPRVSRSIKRQEVKAFFESIRRQGVSPHYHNYLYHSLFNHIEVFADAVRLAVMGYHTRKITKLSIQADELYTNLRDMYENLVNSGEYILHNVQRESMRLLKRARRLPHDYRIKPERAYRQINEHIMAPDSRKI